MPAAGASVNDVRNVSTAAALAGDDDLLHYRKRTFRVPSVPFAPGARLQWLRSQFMRFQNRELTEGEWLEYGGYVKEALDAMYVMLRPFSLWDKLTWRLRDNPLLDADAAEVGAMMDFFSLCQMRSRVRHDAWRHVEDRSLLPIS